MEMRAIDKNASKISEPTCNLAYFREFINSNQCELIFLINTKIPDIGFVKEEIKAVRQRSDTVESLVQHIKNKLHKILQEKFKLKENQLTKIIVAFKRGNKHVKGAMILKHFPDFACDRPVTLEIFNQKFSISINAPLVKELKLPPVLFANFTVQPKFHAMFTGNAKPLFWWYKSRDKARWEILTEGFTYSIKPNDANHYLKVVCRPINDMNIEGPTTEVISESKVAIMANLPTCPFEKRHVFTDKKLCGLAFRVVSYNTLSDRYTDSENFPYCPPKALSIDYRKLLIIKELLGYNADIICLQEVDNNQYSSFFKAKFKEAGYGCIYHRKGNRIPEGLACFFNKSRYKLVLSKQIVLAMEIKRHKAFTFLWNLINKNNDLKTDFLRQSTSLQVTVLKTNDKRYLIVGNTHLFYHPEAKHIRLMQVNMITIYLNILKRQYLRDGLDVSVIFCGDFNSTPKNSVFPYMIEGCISPDHEDCLKINENGKALLYHEFIFESSCGTPKYTNYTEDFKDCLDYIFIETNKLKVQQIVPFPDEEQLCKYKGLPNEYYPSDHLALVVDLSFKVT